MKIRVIGVAVIAAAGIALASAVIPDASAAAGSNRLDPNQHLVAGERLVSPDGRYVLTMQSDGKLVEYAPGNRAVWASATSRANSVTRMQTDGNLVVIGPGNVPLWSTRTSGNAGATLELQSDGNLVVYAPGHVARWATGTPDAAGLADRIAAVANAEAADTARNHEAGGTDCNFYTTDLGAGRPCGNGWRAEAWCADFARWVWAHAGARTAGLDAGAVSFRNHAAWTPGASLTGVRVGDVVGYRFDTGTHGDDHVGVVVATAPGTVTTVEGNYSNGVHRVTVTRGWSDITGYARPQTR